MVFPRFLLPIVGLAAVGCAQKQVPAPASAAALDEIAQNAAAQVKRCYRSPRIPSSGKQIITRLRVQYREDGGLAALPVVLSQAGLTPENSPYAGKMAEAAGLAVMRCAPVRLPPDKHKQGWSTLELIFSPTARV